MNAKILIADDDSEVLEFLKFTFEAEDYNVITASEGEEALALVRDEHPDIVILDVNMPKLSGFEVCEKIRADSSICLIPIVMLTSYAKTKDRITGIKLGADDYLDKPFESVEIVARVEGLLKRTKESLSANPLTGMPGNVTIEAETRKRLEEGRPFSVIYIDLDHFKSYNDKYGFEKGDNVIRLVATIIRASASAAGNKNDFLGNIGGDDFIIITTPDKVNDYSSLIIKYFDDMIPQQYSDDDRAKGFMMGISRQGQEVKFPLMSISLGVANVAKDKYRHYSQVVEQAKDMLKQAKLKEGSSLAIG
jgi:diguanylate cyclase (GGDEF)-like protein